MKITEALTTLPMPPNRHTGPLGWLRDHVARFSDGDDHRRRRALTDPTDIAALAGGIPVPINILYSPGLDLTELGVGRVSLGSLLFRAALHAATGLARTIRAGEPIPEGIPGYRDIERLIPLTP